MAKEQKGALRELLEKLDAKIGLFAHRGHVHATLILARKHVGECPDKIAGLIRAIDTIPNDNQKTRSE